MIATPHRTCRPFFATVATELLQLLRVFSLWAVWRQRHHPIGCFRARYIPRTREPGGAGGVDFLLTVSSAATTTAAALGFDPDEQRVIEERRGPPPQRPAPPGAFSIGVVGRGVLLAPGFYAP